MSLVQLQTSEFFKNFFTLWQYLGAQVIDLDLSVLIPQNIAL